MSPGGCSVKALASGGRRGTVKSGRDCTATSSAPTSASSLSDSAPGGRTIDVSVRSPRDVWTVRVRRTNARRKTDVNNAAGPRAETTGLLTSNTSNPYALS